MLRDLLRARALILTYEPDTGAGCDDRTLRDMAAPQYRLDAGTRTMVELKKATKKRLGHSPGRWRRNVDVCLHPAQHDPDHEVTLAPRGPLSVLIPLFYRHPPMT